jgi:hypothetical protein
VWFGVTFGQNDDTTHAEWSFGCGRGKQERRLSTTM